MANSGFLEQISLHTVIALLGVRADGLPALRGEEKCLNIVSYYGDSLLDQRCMDGTNAIKSAYNDAALANAMAGQRSITALDKAVSGTRGDQILQSFLADVNSGALAASGTGTVEFDMGTNDVVQTPYTDVVSGAAITAANVAANVVSNAAILMDTAISMGIQVHFRTVHGASNMTAAQIGAVADINKGYRALAKSRKKVWLLEVRDILRDQLVTSLTAFAFKTGYLKTDAGPVLIHEAVPGSFYVAKKKAAILAASMPSLPQNYADGSEQYSANQISQIMLNPNFSGTSGVLGARATLGLNPAGGALAGVPTSWSLQPISGDTTSTCTINVKEDTTSRFVELVITPGQASGGFRLISTGIANANYNFGDRLQGFATSEVTAPSSQLACVCPYVEVNGTTGGVNTTLSAAGCYNDAVHGVFPPTEAFVLEDATEPTVVPTYDTKGYVGFSIKAMFAAASATATTVRLRFPRLDVLPAAPAVAA